MQDTPIITAALVGQARTGKSSYLMRLITGDWKPRSPTQQPSMGALPWEGCIFHLIDCPPDTVPEQQCDAYIVFHPVAPTITQIYPDDVYVVNVMDPIGRTSVPKNTLRALTGSFDRSQRLHIVSSKSHLNLEKPLQDIAKEVVPKKIALAALIMDCRRHLCARKIQRWWKRYYYTPNSLGFSVFLNRTYDDLCC